MKSSGAARYVIGAILVGVGLLLLLARLGVISIDWSLAGTWWPALLIFWGVWGLFRHCFRFRLGSALLLILGFTFQVSELVWGVGAAQLWPILLLIGGIILAMLIMGQRSAVSQHHLGGEGHLLTGSYGDLSGYGNHGSYGSGGDSGSSGSGSDGGGGAF